MNLGDPMTPMEGLLFMMFLSVAFFLAVFGPAILDLLWRT